VHLEPYDEVRVIVLDDVGKLEATLKDTMKLAKKGPIKHKGTGVSDDANTGSQQGGKASKQGGEEEKRQEEEEVKTEEQGGGQESGKSEEEKLREGAGPGQQGAGVHSQVEQAQGAEAQGLEDHITPEGNAMSAEHLQARDAAGGGGGGDKGLVGKAKEGLGWVAGKMGAGGK
jgi:hypothetical protein